MNYVPNLLDPRGRLLPRSYDALGNALILSFDHVIACKYLGFNFTYNYWGTGFLFPMQVSIQLLYFKSLTQISHPPLPVH